jgi:hypothetical protein
MPGLSFRPPPADFWIAASEGDIGKIRAALNEGVDPNAKDQHGYTALAAAVSYGHKDLLALLVEKGSDVNVRDEQGDTPLFVCESIEMARLLVQTYDADISMQNDAGFTASEQIRQDNDEDTLQVADFLDGIYTGQGIKVERQAGMPEEEQDQEEDPSVADIRERVQDIIENANDPSDPAVQERLRSTVVDALNQSNLNQRSVR